MGLPLALLISHGSVALLVAALFRRRLSIYGLWSRIRRPQ